MGKTFSELKTLLVSYNPNSAITDAMWTDFTNIALRNVETEYNFRGMIKRVYPEVTVAADDATYDAPTGYKELDWAYFKDSDGTRHEIVKDSTRHGLLVSSNLTDDTGTPSIISYAPKYATGDTVFEWLLRPTPDAAGTLDISYYGYSDELSDDADTNYLLDGPWNILLYGALAEAAIWEKSEKDAAKWMALRDQKASKLVNSERMEKFAGSYQEFRSGYVLE